MNWDDAKASCAKLGNGWRLPEMNEFWLFQDVFFDKELGDFKQSFYWGDRGANESARWYHFSPPRGLSVDDSKSDLKWVRAVKTV